MDAFTTFNVTINGNSDSINKIGTAIKETIKDVDFEIAKEMLIEETYDCVFEEDLCELAKSIARVAGNASFEIKGHIDTSASAGEYMDFLIQLQNGKLTAQFSDWYVETCMESFDDYEDFCEGFFECSQEEYDKFSDCEFVNIIEAAEGDYLSKDVPLGEERVLEF